MKIAFKTFGCKANTVDSDALYHEAIKRGFQVVDEAAEIADCYVINSCTVTNAADRDARREALKYKRQNPLALIGVVGCYAQVAKDELLRLPEVDYVIGTANKFRILDQFKEGAAAESLRDLVEVPKGFLPENFPGSRHARASVKIQDGCNFSCSFCIIPQARGRSRSLSIDVVLRQIDEAYAKGFQEITLTGIHIAHYGWDLNTDLMTLLRAIFAKPQGPRIRVTTLDPFEIPDEMIQLMAMEKRFCPHFHIAIQSGSNKVLAGMRRIYKAEEFVEVTDKVAKWSPDTFIGVDVIVGFPGEGNLEFQETLSCLERSYWTKLHVFPFSARKGTRAEVLPDPVRDCDKTDRSRQLRELSENRYDAFLKSQIGKTREVLLEQPSAKYPGLWKGHTENYLPTYSQAPGAEAKVIVTSKITGFEKDRLLTTPSV